MRANGGQYLVETDPRFANHQQWLGSDYLLAALGVDPAHLHKRLGDGYYEQMLIRDQIGELTGRRFLDGYASDEAQYRALMEAGATFAAQWNLRPGIALSAAQMAQLTSDIVWLVEQTVTLPDGSTTTALVPQVYLRVAPGDLNEHGALLAGADVDIRLSGTLVNTGAVAGRHVVSISADSIKNLSGGSISGQMVGLSAAKDIEVIGATVSASDVLNVKAGGDITVASTTQTQHGGGYTQTTVDRVAGLYVTNPSGVGVLSVQAGGDVTLQGAQVRNAGTDGVTHIRAEGDLTLGTVTTSRTTDITGDARNYQRSAQTTHVGSTVQGAGNVVLQAGNDIALTAAQLQAGQAMALRAGNDIRSDVAVDSNSQQLSAHTRNQSRQVDASSETVRGTTFQAGSDLVMQADNDIVLQAATVTSDAGGIALAAGRDVRLTTADEHHSLEVNTRSKKSGTLSSTTTTTHDKVTDTYAIGTTVSGERVDVSAGNDILMQGALVAGDRGVSLVAGNDITLQTGVNTHTESHRTDQKKSGAFSSGGFGFTVGSQKTGSAMELTQTTHSGTLIGSAEGRVDIVAGNDVTITGSDVLSQAGTLISGKNVTIEHAQDTLEVTQSQYAKSGGLKVSLKGGVVDVATTVYDSAKRAGEVEDERLAGLHAAKAAQTLFSPAAGGGQTGMSQLGNIDGQVSDLANTFKTGKTEGGNGLSLRIGIGASSSKSEVTTHETGVHGSTIRSNGDVAIVAREGNLTVTGSRVEGENVGLAAKQDILLQSAQQTTEQRERSKASSGEVGVTVGTEAGIGVYVSASGARGKGDGASTQHVETVIQGNRSVSFASGGNTTLEGAQIIAERVIGQVGGDLTIRSQQDSDTYARKDQSAGIDAAVGIGGGQVSVNYAQSQIDSNYTSVREQSGIQAGSGGFQIQVGGHTQLDGGAIASTATPGNNYFSTGSLGYSDLKNEAEYKATSVSVSASGGTNGGGGNGSFMQQDDKASSVTRAGIADGTLIVKDGSGGDIARGVTELQQDGLKEIYDAQKVAERMEMGQLAGEVGFTAVGDLALSRQKDAVVRQQQAQERFDEAASNGDQAGMAAAMADLATARQDFQSWSDGSTKKTALHVVVGGIQAAFGGGNAMAGALGAGASEWVAGQSDSALLGIAAGIAAGAAAGSAGAGASASLAGDQYNRQLHEGEQKALADLVAQGYEREVINAVACNVAKCWEGSGLGVMAKAVEEQTAQVMASLTPAQQESLLSTLRAEAPGLFEYTLKDYVSDAWKESPGLQEGLVRTGGALQALGGYGTAVVGSGLAAGGGATCLETGVGCVAMLGGWSMLGWGADQMTAGATTLLQGTQAPTLGGYTLQQITGMSPANAELTYGLLGLTPAAIEAYAINKGVDAALEANKLAVASYQPFTTGGLRVTDEVLQTPQAQAMIAEIRAGSPGLAVNDAVNYARIYLSSGTSIPTMGKATSGSLLVKVVPKGETVSAHTGFWMSVEEARAVALMSPSQAAKVFGLPASQAAKMAEGGVEYYAISPKIGQQPTIFTSVTARTSQGEVVMPGGMKQVIVPDRSKWTEPKKINPFSLGSD